jgi:hypothetical protein
VSWVARILDDGERLRRVKLIGLEGRRDELDHQRALLRQDLSVELQRRCRNGQKTAAAITLEEKIGQVHGQWKQIIGEIRELQSQRSPA